MSCETGIDSYSYSSKYRPFSVSSPDILNDTITTKKLSNDDIKFNYDQAYSNKLNQGKFAFNLASKLNGTSKFKFPQMSLSNNELFAPKDGNWMNGVTKYLKPILSYININKNQTRDSVDQSSADDWLIPIEDLYPGYPDNHDNPDKQNIIGSGNQGIVYVYNYKKLKKLVALKEVKDLKINQIEVHYLKQLKHKNIIEFIGVTSTGHIVMEYCSNGSLYEALKDGSITKDYVVKWSKQIVKGMKYLHDHKIVHRDLKSPNILIDMNRKLKICDFGNCKRIDEIKSRMSFAGTVAWMSPEVIRGDVSKEHSEKIDIWSFGVVLWELIFCERPYKNLEQNVIMHGVGNMLLRLPIPETCPAKFKSIMQKCLSYEAKERPDFGQILNDLKIASKDFQSAVKSDDDFYELKKKWKDEIDRQLSTVKKMCSSSDEDSVYKHKENVEKVQKIKIELEKELQTAKELLRKIKEREERIERKERELGIKYDLKSTSNSLVNSLGRKLLKNMSSKNKTSSLKLSRFVRNRSRRSYRLHCAQKQMNKAMTKDAEIQTNFFDFDDQNSDELNCNENYSHHYNDELLNSNQFKYYKSDSGYSGNGYSGNGSITSCLSTPIVKHKILTTNFYNSSLANPELNQDTNQYTNQYANQDINQDTNQIISPKDIHLEENDRSKNSFNKKIVNNGFRLHNQHTSNQQINDNLNSIQEVHNELPGGYLEASFENSLMLKNGSNNYCKFDRSKYVNTFKDATSGLNGLIDNLNGNDIKRTNLSVNTYRFKEGDTETSNDERQRTTNASSDDETDNLSVDSLNNNKYSKIYRASSDSLSSSISWTELNKSKLSIESDISKPFNVLKFDSVKKSPDEPDASSLTVNSSYVVIPKRDQKTQSTQNYLDNYLVLNSPTKDQLSKKNVRDSLLLYKSKGLKKDDKLLI